MHIYLKYHETVETHEYLKDCKKGQHCLYLISFKINVMCGTEKAGKRELVHCELVLACDILHIM